MKHGHGMLKILGEYNEFQLLSMPRLLANGSQIVTHIKMLRIISCTNEMNSS
jgi:hypothetical protein